LGQVELRGGPGETQVSTDRFEALQTRDGRQMTSVQHIQAREHQHEKTE
jgi:hypothetical protein